MRNSIQALQCLQMPYAVCNSNQKTDRSRRPWLERAASSHVNHCLLLSIYNTQRNPPHVSVAKYLSFKASLPARAASPSPSTPGTPSLGPTVFVPTPSSSQTSLTGSHFPSVPPASTLPGSHLSGRLIGVVTLTDILNLFARSTGLNPSDPNEQRARRRRSSSSSIRPSIESSRASLDIRR